MKGVNSNQIINDIAADLHGISISHLCNLGLKENNLSIKRAQAYPKQTPMTIPINPGTIEINKC